jgi:SAM-dependent methyltransferase
VRADNCCPPEHLYGHPKRLHWIVSHLRHGDTIVEFGCGTGYRISLPLAKMGYSVFGIDSDEKSIRIGQDIFRQEGFDPGILKIGDLSVLDIVPDVIIASEVLEHMVDEQCFNALRVIRSKLKPGGRLLVTVPNGSGWFEKESFLWFKTALGVFLQKVRIHRIFGMLKYYVFRCHVAVDPHLSTLDSSPHLQRFTYDTIKNLLLGQGFRITDMTGSVLFAGPFSNMMFTGMIPVMKLNCALGRRLPRLASGFYIGCRSQG